MNRTGLLIALAIAIAVGMLFGFYPDLDIRIAELFYAPQSPGSWIGFSLTGRRLREVAGWTIALIAAPAFVAIALKLLLPRRPMLVPARAAVLMITTLALGPGLLANVILKDNWGRPRPMELVQFGGPERFVPWWDPRGDCPKNCSFISGEPSGAFWTLVPAALAPPHWRALAYAGALTFGAAVGLLRMSAGGHFFSDVVFAGVFTFVVIWLMHGLLYRWRTTRTTDAAIERALERLRGPGPKK